MLLERLGLDFSCVSPEIDESRQADEGPSDLVLRLSREKARAVASNHPGSLVIASDQVAECDGVILCKPGNRENAKKQLMSMNHKTVSFHTGLCVLDTDTNNNQTDNVLFRVMLRDLSEAEIERYLDRESPFDCAGSFKSEGLGITLFDKMEGNDPTALIGLPLIRLGQMLREYGVELP